LGEPRSNPWNFVPISAFISLQAIDPLVGSMELPLKFRKGTLPERKPVVPFPVKSGSIIGLPFGFLSFLVTKQLLVLEEPF